MSGKCCPKCPCRCNDITGLSSLGSIEDVSIPSFVEKINNSNFNVEEMYEQEDSSITDQGTSQQSLNHPPQSSTPLSTPKRQSTTQGPNASLAQICSTIKKERLSRDRNTRAKTLSSSPKATNISRGTNDGLSPKYTRPFKRLPTQADIVPGHDMSLVRPAFEDLESPQISEPSGLLPSRDQIPRAYRERFDKENFNQGIPSDFSREGPIPDGMDPLWYECLMENFDYGVMLKNSERKALDEAQMNTNEQATPKEQVIGQPINDIPDQFAMNPPPQTSTPVATRGEQGPNTSLANICSTIKKKRLSRDRDTKAKTVAFATQAATYQETHDSSSPRYRRPFRPLPTEADIVPGYEMTSPDEMFIGRPSKASSLPPEVFQYPDWHLQFQSEMFKNKVPSRSSSPIPTKNQAHFQYLVDEAQMNTNEQATPKEQVIDHQSEPEQLESNTPLQSSTPLSTSKRQSIKQGPNASLAQISSTIRKERLSRDRTTKAKTLSFSPEAVATSHISNERPLEPMATNIFDVNGRPSKAASLPKETQQADWYTQFNFENYNNRIPSVYDGFPDRNQSLMNERTSPKTIGSNRDISPTGPIISNEQMQNITQTQNVRNGRRFSESNSSSSGSSSNSSSMPNSGPRNFVPPINSRVSPNVFTFDPISTGDRSSNQLRFTDNFVSVEQGHPASAGLEFDDIDLDESVFYNGDNPFEAVMLELSVIRKKLHICQSNLYKAINRMANMEGLPQDNLQRIIDLKTNMINAVELQFNNYMTRYNI